MTNLDRVFTGVVSDTGRLDLDRKADLKAHLLELAGSAVEVVVRPRRDTRSSNQNRYYFGAVVRPLADHLGYTEDELHEALKWKFLRKEAEGPLATVRSTASLDTVEFEDYLERVRTWASAELSYTIPLPGEIDLDLAA